jgi:hypothetical protein
MCTFVRVKQVNRAPVEQAAASAARRKTLAAAGIEKAAASVTRCVRKCTFVPLTQVN